MLALAVVVVRLVLLEPFSIPSSSMAPTLLPGDRVLVDKITSRSAHPRRRDLVVFVRAGDPEGPSLKRVVGVAGDRIEIRNGILSVNDRPIRERLCRLPTRRLSLLRTSPSGRGTGFRARRQTGQLPRLARVRARPETGACGASGRSLLAPPSSGDTRERRMSRFAGLDPLPVDTSGRFICRRNGSSPRRSDLERRAVAEPRVGAGGGSGQCSLGLLSGLVEGLELRAPDEALLELREPPLDERLRLGSR